jgi:transmembrane sensor
MEYGSRTQLNTQIYEEACEWFLEFRTEEPDATARRKFDAWMRRSPEHVAAYLEVAAIWDNPGSHDAAGKRDCRTLIAEAAAERDNVVPLMSAAFASAPEQTSRVPEPSSQRGDVPSPTSRDVRSQDGDAPLTAGRKVGSRTVRATLAAAILTVSIGAGLYVWLTRAPTYSTAIGEQRLISLSDGSTMELNARTKLVVRYTPSERVIELLEGQALFRVAKDATRPFVVNSGDTRVRAVGTQFDVYKKRTHVIVTVVEGRVAIEGHGTGADVTTQPNPNDGKVVIGKAATEGAAPSEPTASPSLQASAPSGELASNPAAYLAAGEQLIVAPDAIQKPPHPNVSNATAWLRRKIVFNRASLSEVAEEFNRYSARQLVIEDPALHDFHVSGVFSSTDIGSVVRFLRDRSTVEVVETPSEIRVRKKNP